MAMHNQLPKRFTKHVVRKALNAASAPLPAQHHGVPSHIQARDFVATKAKLQTSGLTLFEVAIILGGLAGLFVLAVFIGLILKFANRPKTEARHPQYTPKGMYQPSAAGYGTATPRPEDSFHDISSAKAGLLDSAVPMGHGGIYEDADSSMSSGGYHPSADDARRPLARGHTRGASTGIDISAPSAAFRRNASGQHPPIGANHAFDGPQYSTRGGYASDRAPDGSGFVPGQPINQSAVFGSPPRNAPQGIIHARQASLNPNGQPRPSNRGPPPSTTRTRPGRYANASQDSTATNGTRRSRIDSIGPGTYRKSMYLNENNSAVDQNSAPHVRRTPSGRDGAPVNLRRVDSVGKGDPRRTSRYQPGARGGRLPSMMDLDGNGAMPTRTPPRNAFAPAGDQMKGEAGWGGNDLGSAPGYVDQNGRSARGPLGPLTPNGADNPSYAPGFPVRNPAPMNVPNAGRMAYGGPQQQQRQPYPQPGPRPGYPVMASGGYGAQNGSPNRGMYPPSSRPMQTVPGVGGAGRPIL